MARGKQKSSASARRRGQLESTVQSLRAELAMEQTALLDAESALEDVARLRAALEAENTSIAEEITPLVDALRSERDYLRRLHAKASGHHTRVTEAWEHYSSACMDATPGATRLESTEAFMAVMGLSGYLTSGDIVESKVRGLDRVTRLQRARGERRTVSDTTHEQSREGRVALVLDLSVLAPGIVRPAYRKRLIDRGVIAVEANGTHVLRDAAELTAQQNTIRDEAIERSERIWRSHADDLDADSVHVWGQGNLVSTTGDEGEVRRAFGYVRTYGAVNLKPGDRSSAERSFGHAAPPPIASVPASERAALAQRPAEDMLRAWRDVLATRHAVSQRLGLSVHPFAPIAHHPHPAQGLAVQAVYARAAFSGWLHETSTTDLPDAGPSAQAESAIGLTAAATYWLPAGQSAAFADSEPMTETDRAEMTLPFPQVFLAFAEPLVLDPETFSVSQDARQPHGTAGHNAADRKGAFESWRSLSQIAHDAYGRDETAGAVCEALSRSSRDDSWQLESIDDLIRHHGAHVEGMLLLGDQLGRPADLFAWCLTIPGAYGSTLGRFVIPALRSKTQYRDVVDNLTAVVAWAQWHEPDQSTSLPVGMTPAEVEDLLLSQDFQRNAKRAGPGIRVIDVGTTHRARSSTQDDGGRDGGHGTPVAPHIRRGHWRRQRFGTGREQVKRIRIAPVLVNAHRGDIAPRVYRLRRGAVAAALEKVAAAAASENAANE